MMNAKLAKHAKDESPVKPPRDLRSTSWVQSVARQKSTNLATKGIIMTSHRARVGAALAGFAGLILGMAVTVVLRVEAGEQPATQSASRRKVIRPEKTPNTGLPYSPAILVGDTLYLSGNLGRDPATAALVRGGIEAETRQALANIREALRTAGMDFTDVVSVTAYITNFDDFAKFNAVYREYFPNDPPARATVQVAALNVGARVELQMIAAK
jgi:2-iminobutanoate/2-iminopropanoate deaminase